MNLLYIADNGFSFCDGKYYCTAVNKINMEQYHKYFDNIHIIARKSKHLSSNFEIEDKSIVILIEKNNFYALYKAMRELRNNYEIVLMRNGINGCFAGIFGRKLGKKTLAYCGADPYEFNRANKGIIRKKIIAPIWKILERQKMRKADFAQYCTQYLFKIYPTSHPYLICSNVDIAIDYQDLKDRIKKIESISHDKIIGMIGRLDENKGIRTIIRALSKLDGNYKFELIGGGDSEPFEEEINFLGLKDRVKFLGYCSDKKQIKNWLKNVDVYIQPSLSEGLPRSTIEAMAIACPCVASKIGGLPELLENQYLIEPRDYVALSEKIRILSQNKDIAIEAAIKSFEKAKEFQRDIRDYKLDLFFDKIIKEVLVRSK